MFVLPYISIKNPLSPDDPKDKSLENPDNKQNSGNSNTKYSNLRVLFPIMLILIALPLVVSLSLQQQNIRQRAASVDCNDGLTCAGSACTPISNTQSCNYGNGTQSCTYQSSLDGSICTPKTFTGVFCHLDNCSQGYTCSNQQCVATNQPTPTNTPTPTPTPVAGEKVFKVTTSTTISQFQSAVADTTNDVIELAGGTYRWDNVKIDTDRTVRPLLIRPASGATVVFTGSGATTGDGIFSIGRSSAAKYITMDGITSNGFTFDGISLAATGVIGVNGSNHLTLKNMTFKNLVRDPKWGNPSQPYKSWIFYITSETGRTNDDLVIDNITGLSPVVSRDVSAIQVYNGTLRNGNITLSNINLTNYYYAFFNGEPETNLTLSGWTVTNCGNHTTPASIRFSDGVGGATYTNGLYKNIHGVSSDPIFNNHSGGGTMVNGGGNSGL